MAVGKILDRNPYILQCSFAALLGLTAVALGALTLIRHQPLIKGFDHRYAWVSSMAGSTIIVVALALLFRTRKLEMKHEADMELNPVGDLRSQVLSLLTELHGLNERYKDAEDIASNALAWQREYREIMASRQDLQKRLLADEHYFEVVDLLQDPSNDAKVVKLIEQFEKN